MRHHLPHSVSAMVMAALVSLLLPLGAVHASSAQQAKINTYPKHGTVLFSDWQFPDTLNPLQTSIGVSAETYNTMFSELVVLDQQAHLKPDLLMNIPSVKNHEILNGGLTIVLKLKPHQYWSSGVEITSKDVWFGWKMDMDPATGPACLGTCDHISRLRSRTNTPPSCISKTTMHRF